MRTKFGLRHYVGRTATLTATVAAVALIVAVGASASGNAGYTTFDATAGGCLNGASNGINCNLYSSKDKVYMNGGPATGAGLSDGTYYFSVLVPGFQNGGFIDGADGNLSDTTHGSTDGDLGSGDASTCRQFTVSGGAITNNSSSCKHATGTDVQGNPVIQLATYDDTSNPGGVYILAICKVGATSPSDCKYDAFKVKPSNPTPPASDLTVTKSATASFKRPFVWGISKTADPTTFRGLPGASKSISYEIDVNHHAGTDYGFLVDGTVTVFNPNDFGVSGVTVTDDNSNCKLNSSTTTTPSYDSQSLSNQSIAADSTLEIAYECVLSSGGTGSNTATATWSATGDLTGTSGTATSPAANWDFSTVTPALVNACVNVTDSQFVSASNTTGLIATLCLGSDGNPLAGAGYSPDGVLSSVLASGVTAANVAAVVGPPAADAYFKLTYSKTQTITAACTNFVNTATFTGSDNDTVSMTGSAQATVTTVCPTPTGALTMGFWKGPNGQALITYYASIHSPSLWGYLDTLAPLASVNSLADVNAVFKNATATNMNSMLKAQMLATALDVYFSSTGWQSSTVTVAGKTYKAPSSFLPHGGIGTFNMDMTAICPMADNTTAGTATCLNNLPSTDAFASGAVNSSAMTVSAILAFASTVDLSTPPWDLGAYSATANVWYYNTTSSSQDRTKQEILKNIFDQINNGDAFAA